MEENFKRQANDEAPSGVERSIQGIFKKGGRTWVSDDSKELIIRIVVEAHCAERGHRVFRATLELIAEPNWWMDLERCLSIYPVVHTLHSIKDLRNAFSDHYPLLCMAQYLKKLSMRFSLYGTSRRKWVKVRTTKQRWYQPVFVAVSMYHRKPWQGSKGFIQAYGMLRVHEVAGYWSRSPFHGDANNKTYQRNTHESSFYNEILPMRNVTVERLCKRCLEYLERFFQNRCDAWPTGLRS